MLSIARVVVRNRGPLRVRALISLVFALLANPALADVVVPSADVATRVIVRASASSQSAQIGSLRPGEQLELVGSVPNWHEVRLSTGVTGFVSKRWTVVVTTTTPPPAPGAPTFTIDVVDVGTGLGIFVRGSDFTLVYDGGSNDDDARGPNNRMLAFIRAVAPTLTTIDHLMLSHPHKDHLELLPDLLSAYQVNHVWDSGRINDTCGYQTFLSAVRDEPGVQYHNALQAFGTRNYPFDLKKNCYGQALPATVLTLTQASRIDETPIALGQGASMTILHADGAAHGSPNENSFVVRLDLGTTRVLLTGDAEAGGRKPPSDAPTPSSIEGTLVTCCVSELASHILVVGHHGSMTSSRRAFLNAVGASTFIVSSGPTLYSGVKLPDSVIITELTSRGKVFRTDINDDGCKQNPAKFGPDADGRAGGCDNIRVVIPASGPPQVDFFRGADP